MPDEITLDYEPGVLRVFQTKSETKAFYDKIAKVYDLLAEHSERPMREAGIRLLAPAPGEHLLEIGFGTGHILAELANGVGPTGRVFEWTHRHFPNLMDCRPIYARRALQATGFVIEDSLTESMWVPVEIVRGRKPS